MTHDVAVMVMAVVTGASFLSLLLYLYFSDGPVFEVDWSVTKRR